MREYNLSLEYNPVWSYQKTGLEPLESKLGDSRHFACDILMVLDLGGI